MPGGKKQKSEWKIRDKSDFERLHKMMWHHWVPMRQNHLLHPSSLPQNNGRIYYAFYIHRKISPTSRRWHESGTQVKLSKRICRMKTGTIPQKNPVQAPLVILKDVCLGAMMKTSTWKDFLFFFFKLKHCLHLNLKWEQMHKQDGLSVVSVSAYFVYASACVFARLLSPF